jgi:hypothetical protein
VQLARQLLALRAQLVSVLRTRPHEQAHGSAGDARARHSGRERGVEGGAAGSGLWEAEAIVGTVRELVSFERAISEQLVLRPHLAPGGGVPLLAAGQTVSDWALEAVHELVNLEQRLFSSARTFSTAAANMAAAPTQLVHRALALFQKLFDVRELEDVFERMWAVHLVHADAHRLHRAVCKALSVPVDSPVSAVVKLLSEVTPAA